MDRNESEQVNFNIELNGTVYPLEYTFGGENEVDFYIKENTRGIKTVSAYMAEFTLKSLRLQELKEASEKKYNQASLKALQEFDTNMLGYLLWSLMLNERNVNTLTYGEFKKLTFRLYSKYSKTEIISTTLKAYAAGKKKQMEMENSRKPKLEIAPELKLEIAPELKPEG